MIYTFRRNQRATYLWFHRVVRNRSTLSEEQCVHKAFSAVVRRWKRLWWYRSADILLLENSFGITHKQICSLFADWKYLVSNWKTPVFSSTCFLHRLERVKNPVKILEAQLLSGSTHRCCLHSVDELASTHDVTGLTHLLTGRHITVSFFFFVCDGGFINTQSSAALLAS